MLYEQKTEQLRLFGDSMVEEPDGLLPDKLPDDYTPEEVKGHFEVWKKVKKQHRIAFQTIQDMDYEDKLERQKGIAEEFYETVTGNGGNCHVSVGGLDSITLLIWLKSIGIDVPAISVSALEDESIQKVHRALGIEILHSCKTKVEVLNDVGFPVISKRIAGKINALQNPTENNRTVRHAIITGECGQQGHYAKNSRMKLPLKWLKLFGGYENENEGVNYGKPEPDIPVSNECCYWLKEKPCDDWAKGHNSFPYLGLMASEGGQREEALIDHGCNFYGKTVTRSAPFAPFLRQDLLLLVQEMDKWYHSHIEIFEEAFHKQPYGKNKDGTPKEYVPLKTIIPEIYGEIKEWDTGELYTTGAQRTGCSMCGFGIHLEERPHRFDRLRQRNQKEWDFYMRRCCTDPNTGEKYGWGRVLDYMGIGWEDIPAEQIELPLEQMKGG